MAVDIPPAVIEKQKMIDFALNYDNVTLHTDEEYAKTMPFGQTHCSGCNVFYVGLGEIS